MKRSGALLLLLLAGCAREPDGLASGVTPAAFDRAALCSGVAAGAADAATAPSAAPLRIETQTLAGIARAEASGAGEGGTRITVEPRRRNFLSWENPNRPVMPSRAALQGPPEGPPPASLAGTWRAAVGGNCACALTLSLAADAGAVQAVNCGGTGLEPASRWRVRGLELVLTGADRTLLATLAPAVGGHYEGRLTNGSSVMLFR